MPRAPDIEARLAEIEAEFDYQIECEHGAVPAQGFINAPLPTPRLRHPALESLAELAVQASAGNAMPPTVDRYRVALEAADMPPPRTRRHLLAQCAAYAQAAARRQDEAERRAAQKAAEAVERAGQARAALHVETDVEGQQLALQLGVHHQWLHAGDHRDHLDEVRAAVDQTLAAGLEGQLSGGRPIMSWLGAELAAVGAEAWHGRDGRYQGVRVGEGAPTWCRVRCMALQGLRDALVGLAPGASPRALIYVVGLGDELAGDSHLDELARTAPYTWRETLRAVLPAEDDERARSQWQDTRTIPAPGWGA